MRQRWARFALPTLRPIGTQSRNPRGVFGISFSPLVPVEFVWAAAAVAAVVAALLVLARGRGAAIRCGALALMVLALANPSLTREDRDPLTSVAVVVVDKSPSQGFGDRATQIGRAGHAPRDECGQHRQGLAVFRAGDPHRAEGLLDSLHLLVARVGEPLCVVLFRDRAGERGKLARIRTPPHRRNRRGRRALRTVSPDGRSIEAPDHR